jgi:Vacuolar protein sorting-associated protein 35
MHQLLTTLYTRVSPSSAELCLRLFISCGQVADQCGFEEFAYEFFAQAFTIYEDSISDSRGQFQAVCIVAGALQSTRGFGKENYDTLITKAALHGSKLLKKPDQCRAVYLASHLWWGIEIPSRGEEDAKNVSGLPKAYPLVILMAFLSFTVMVSVYLSVCKELFEWQMLAWTHLYQWSCSWRFSIAMSTTLTSRTKR